MVSYKGFDGNLHEPSCSEQEFKEIVIDAMNVAIDYCRRFGVERSNAIDIWEHSYESCGFDIITPTGAYYYSHILTKMLKDVVERQKWTDEPFEVELTF